MLMGTSPTPNCVQHVELTGREGKRRLPRLRPEIDREGIAQVFHRPLDPERNGDHRFGAIGHDRNLFHSPG